MIRNFEICNLDMCLRDDTDVSAFGGLFFADFRREVQGQAL